MVTSGCGRFGLVILLVGALLSLGCRPVEAQSFTVDTIATAISGGFAYDFILNYVVGGVGQPLESDLYRWSFFLDTSVADPTNPLSPLGWQFTYDPLSGEVVWFTEGPGGAGSGDFGPFVLHPGDSLSGFHLESSPAPDLSIAFAEDTTAHSDLTIAALPVTAAVVPEGDSLVLLMGALMAVGLVRLVSRSPRTDQYQNRS